MYCQSIAVDSDTRGSHSRCQSPDDLFFDPQPKGLSGAVSFQHFHPPRAAFFGCADVKGLPLDAIDGHTVEPCLDEHFCGEESTQLVDLSPAHLALGNHVGVSRPILSTHPKNMTMPTKSVRTSGQPRLPEHTEQIRISHPGRHTAAARPQEITTLMVQNLPRLCVPAGLAAELDRSGFAGSFDFVYVPTMFKAVHGKSFGFVNFVSPEVAKAFKRQWGKTWRFEAIDQRTRVNVVDARIQGLQKNMAKWGEHALVCVKNPDFRPLMLSVANR